jgi:hypothetical protein
MHSFTLTIMFLGMASTQVGQMKSFPPYESAAACVQNAFTGCFAGNCVPEKLNCVGWQCVCEDLAHAISEASTIAYLSCSSTAAEGASATSILSAFCHQFYPNVTQTGLSCNEFEELLLMFHSHSYCNIDDYNHQLRPSNKYLHFNYGGYSVPYEHIGALGGQ